jgi:hypothetical protein
MNRGPRQRHWGAGLVFAISVLACRQIVGIDDRAPDAAPPPGPDAAAACGGLGFSPTCQACLSTKCCAEGKTCGDSTTCNHYEGCLGKCGADSGCRSQCLIDAKWAADDATRAFDVCLSQNCADACDAKCGHTTIGVLPTVAAQCDACLERLACPASKACSVDPVCQQAFWCRAACRTYDCSQACDDPAASGSRLWSDLLAEVQKCAVDCKFGQYWACVGSVAFPHTESDKIHVTGTVVDFGLNGVPGVTFRACHETDLTCAASLATPTTATTDAKGKFAFDIAMPKVGAGAFTGYIQTDLSDLLMPQMLFVPMLSRSKWDVWLPTFRTSELYPLAIASGAKAIDPERGHLIVRAIDCFQNFAAEVEISASSADSQTTRAYVKGTLPFPDATMTDGSGSVGFVNMPVGPTEVTLLPKSLGGKIGAKRTVFIRKGTFTWLDLGPTP